MSQKNQQRFVLFFIPVLLNLLLIFSGLTLVPRQARANAEPEDPTPLPAENSFDPEQDQNLSFTPNTFNPIETHTIHLKSREFQPSPQNTLDVQTLQQLASQGVEHVHVLVQLDFIPREKAKNEYAAQGLQLLAYVPDYAWIASLDIARLNQALALPGLFWMGELTVEDKLDPAIQGDRWSSWNLAPNGTAAVYLALHKDESLETGRQLAKKHGGEVKGEVIGINLLVLEIPNGNLFALAAEDAVQWIEPAAPPLEGANDGIRDQIGVNTVNASPYNLDGTGIDVLIYDSGQVGAHVDFGTRLINGDTDLTNEHSTHVAGTIGGSGSNSTAQGGTTLQWAGMAPNVDLISFGTEGYDAINDILFYNNIPDIENDFAAAQNTYGADLANGSLSSNIYSNDPEDCWVMGRYGSSSLLLDQIIRGGNSVVGIGDKYITAWAVGNERGWGTSCGTYNIISPPSAAKNPIHVGGSNTNDNTQYVHTSWGPTLDGRIKPIVTAGGCQTTSDGGIKSTDNSPINTYTVMCGTSMATPAVSGGIALMLQHYRDVYNTSGTFWPATAKAILMQTADDFGNPGPDYQWGFGQVDIHAAVDLISRKAFRQENITAGQVDVFSFVVPPDAGPITVSLAWDDFEATFNANPTLINNLDLELVSPTGTVWHPWILNPSSPTNAATRGVDTVNNQEQVQVPAPEVGTWMVRVRGTTVPQGPQDYALVCEGCQPLDVGVCQAEIGGTVSALTLAESDGLPLNESSIAEETLLALETQKISSIGETWQINLEAASDPATTRRDAEFLATQTAFEAARKAGPEAIVALQTTLRGRLLDLYQDEILEAQEALWAKSPPPPESPAVSEAQEAAALETQLALDAENRARALVAAKIQIEGQVPYSERSNQAVNSYAPLANLTVGNGCSYATISAAIAAANPNDILLIEGGVTFNENITVNKDLTLRGGYAGCNSSSAIPTIIHGTGSGVVVTINGGWNVTLENLAITNGSIFGVGGGIHVNSGDGIVYLNQIELYQNAALGGGGLAVGENATVIGDGVEIHDNSGGYGGGVYLYGGDITLSDSNVYSNTANSGGGIYGGLSDSFSPSINLLSYADVYNNQALAGDGFGGGIHLSEGSISIADCSDIASNDAVAGGGVFLITSTLTIEGSCSEIQFNSATENGGGVYAQNSTVNLDNEAELYNNSAGSSGTGSGGGAYLDAGSLYSDKSSIRYNHAGEHGGGIFGTNRSTIDMDLGSYTCLGTHCSSLYGNAADSLYGGGIYANNSAIWLDNIFIENNSATLGGGIYATNTSLSINNSLIARNNATSATTTGDAIRLYTNASMAGVGNTFAYNDANGASTGRAIDALSANLSLGCSIIWGHNSSITPSGHDVIYSDIQGGYAGTGNLNINPLFVASASYDYHLQSGSPVIDRCPALTGLSPDFENEVRPIVMETAATPYDMGADEVSGTDRVGINGAGCTFGTIQQAVNAASPGDSLQIAGGVYFESVDISTGKNITLNGGYDSSCLASTGGVSRLEGSLGSGSTVDVIASTVAIYNMEISWGKSTGAGLDLRSGAQVTLNNTDVYNNHGTSGGGVYISSNSILTLINDADINNNTASGNGGGAYISGQLISNDTYSDITDNCASHGGGLAVLTGGEINLENNDIMENQALDPNARGGGIYLAAGSHATLTGNAWFSKNRAYDGGGIYADGANINLSSANITFVDNAASHYGGGLYLLNNSVLNANGARIGYSTLPSYGNVAVYGAGLYIDNSTINFTGVIVNNLASSAGAGLYATGSTINLIASNIGGTGAYEANQLSSAGHYGAGMHLTGGTQAVLDQSLVAGNRFQTTGFAYGGGAYISGGSTLTLTNNSRIQEHTAPSITDGRGAGIYLNNSSTTIDHSQVISNTAGAIGGGIRIFGTSTLSIINDSVIAANQAQNGEGGGITGSSGSVINISQAKFEGNSASTNGGAIFQDGGELNIAQASFANNSAAKGGAIFQIGASAHTEIENTLIYANISLSGLGAGIRSEEGAFDLTHVTLADNQGGAGYSQINTAGSVTNSLAWGNSIGGFVISSGTISSVCNLDQSGNLGESLNPQFVSPGAGKDYHLLDHSPAIDACTTGLSVDLDGTTRPFGYRYDIGAYEFFVNVFDIFLPIIMR